MDAKRILEISNENRPEKVDIEYDIIKSLILEAAKKGLYKIHYDQIVFKENIDKLMLSGFKLQQDYIIHKMAISWN